MNPSDSEISAGLMSMSDAVRSLEETNVLKTPADGGPPKDRLAGRVMLLPNFGPGGLVTRFVASALDAMFCLSLLVTFQLPLLLFGFEMPRNWQIIAVVLGTATALISIYFYHVWSYWYRGATIGKYVMGLRVIDATTGLNLSTGQVILREFFGKGLLGIVSLPLSLFPVVFGRERKAIHDMIAHTIVIRKVD